MTVYSENGTVICTSIPIYGTEKGDSLILRHRERWDSRPYHPQQLPWPQEAGQLQGEEICAVRAVLALLVWLNIKGGPVTSSLDGGYAAVAPLSQHPDLCSFNLQPLPY